MAKFKELDRQKQARDSLFEKQQPLNGICIIIDDDDQEIGICDVKRNNLENKTSTRNVLNMHQNMDHKRGVKRNREESGELVNHRKKRRKGTKGAKGAEGTKRAKSANGAKARKSATKATRGKRTYFCSWCSKGFV